MVSRNSNNTRPHYGGQGPFHQPLQQMMGHLPFAQMSGQIPNSAPTGMVCPPPGVTHSWNNNGGAHHNPQQMNGTGAFQMPPLPLMAQFNQPPPPPHHQVATGPNGNVAGQPQSAPPQATGSAPPPPTSTPLMAQMFGTANFHPQSVPNTPLGQASFAPHGAGFPSQHPIGFASVDGATPQQQHQLYLAASATAIQYAQQPSFYMPQIATGNFAPTPSLAGAAAIAQQQAHFLPTTVGPAAVSNGGQHMFDAQQPQPANVAVTGVHHQQQIFMAHIQQNGLQQGQVISSTSPPMPMVYSVPGTQTFYLQQQAGAGGQMQTAAIAVNGPDQQFYMMAHAQSPPILVQQQPSPFDQAKIAEQLEREELNRNMQDIRQEQLQQSMHCQQTNKGSHRLEISPPIQEQAQPANNNYCQQQDVQPPMMHRPQEEHHSDLGPNDAVQAEKPKEPMGQHPQKRNASPPAPTNSAIEQQKWRPDTGEREHQQQSENNSPPEALMDKLQIGEGNEGRQQADGDNKSLPNNNAAPYRQDTHYQYQPQRQEHGGGGHPQQFSNNFGQRNRPPSQQQPQQGEQQPPLRGRQSPMGGQQQHAGRVFTASSRGGGGGYQRGPQSNFYTGQRSPQPLGSQDVRFAGGRGGGGGGGMGGDGGGGGGGGQNRQYHETKCDECGNFHQALKCPRNRVQTEQLDNFSRKFQEKGNHPALLSLQQQQQQQNPHQQHGHHGGGGRPRLMQQQQRGSGQRYGGGGGGYGGGHGHYSYGRQHSNASYSSYDGGHHRDGGGGGGRRYPPPQQQQQN